MFVNYPNNPTAAVADESFFLDLVVFARKHDLVILADNAYSEVYFEPKDKPISIMQIPNAKDISIEIHSFSKTFNMTGWRIGFIVGSKSLIDAVLTLKSNFDSGVFMAIQRAAARALGHPDAPLFNDRRTRLFKVRRDIIASALEEMGFRFKLPRASYYFWVGIPENYSSSVAFCADLLEQQGLIVTPGVGYGPSGEAYFRISMTAEDNKIQAGYGSTNKICKGIIMKASLVLADGESFLGTAVGAAGEIVGEVVFNTAITGYQEILTDPSYRGQIVTMTYPHIGNTGVNFEDNESVRAFLSGFIVKEHCSSPSNWRQRENLGDFLKRSGVIGIQGIDTRRLTRNLRETGSQKGIISTEDHDVGSLLR